MRYFVREQLWHIQRWLGCSLMLLWVVACDGAATPIATPAPTPAPTRVAAATPTRAPTAPPTNTPVRAPTATTAAATPSAAPRALRLHSLSEPKEIDPQRASAANEFDVVMKVFGNLLRWNAAGELEPDMAAEMPQVSEDGLYYTFKLRRGLKYSDGQPLSAKDFEFGWKRQLDPEVGSDYAFTGFILDGSEEYNSADPKKVSKDQLRKLRDEVGVKALDDLTVEFALKKKAPYFLAILASGSGLPTRQDLIAKHGAKWTTPATYIGNGPYILSEWQRNVKLVFTANPNYAHGKPPIERIEQIVVNSAAALAAYQNNELDVVQLGGAEWTRARQDSNLSAQLVQRTGNCSFYFGFNNTRAPFDSLKVRHAFAQAIDREEYVKLFEPSTGKAHAQLVPPELPGHFAELKTLAFDAEAAKKELAAAGYPNGNRLAEIKYGYIANGRNQARAEWLQGQLKDHLGVEIKLEPLDAKTYNEALKKNATTPSIYLSGWCQEYSDPQNWYSNLFDSRSLLSATGWKSDRYDRMVRSADIDLDPARRASVYRQTAQVLVDEAPVVFLFYNVQSQLLRPSLGGVKLTPFDTYFSSTTVMDLKLPGR